MGIQAPNGQNNYEESIATNEENDMVMWIINYLLRKGTKQKANASSIVVEDPIFITLSRIRYKLSGCFRSSFQSLFGAGRKGECKQRE
ncbi:hypothetical protein PanWU01x14_080190 [Parasponia andersonii]|uniref:Uncharacterized protein n=1 Tax=Parasponia andersonii TaxID=3476 RepID=A0A2P5DBI7_PARAD|nr:hypothetical protein PanWU01x14_080190 [Parasponia andersonii]